MEDSREHSALIENIELFTNSSIRIKDGDKTIYIDSYKMWEEPHDADFILITHDHYDHYSQEDIKKVAGKNTILIVPERMKERAEKEVGRYVSRIETVLPGNKYEVDGLSFETVPAYNTFSPFHKKEDQWVGYLLMIKGKRIYIAGDTDINEDNEKVRCDVALVPVGGVYTMDYNQAADLVRKTGAQVAIPTHYGTGAGNYLDAKFFQSILSPSVKVEIIMQKTYVK